MYILQAVFFMTSISTSWHRFNISFRFSFGNSGVSNTGIKFSLAISSATLLRYLSGGIKKRLCSLTYEYISVPGYGMALLKFTRATGYFLANLMLSSMSAIVSYGVPTMINILTSNPTSQAVFTALSIVSIFSFFFK